MSCGTTTPLAKRTEGSVVRRRGTYLVQLTDGSEHSFADFVPKWRGFILGGAQPNNVVWGSGERITLSWLDVVDTVVGGCFSLPTPCYRCWWLFLFAYTLLSLLVVVSLCLHLVIVVDGCFSLPTPCYRC